MIALAFFAFTAGALPAGIKAYSMLTHDGRRLVSHVEGTNTVFELVHTNALPANLPPVREWTLYAVKSAHTDIGLHNSQYIQRHGTVRRIDEARRLIAADPDDSDPAAFRYVAEGAWFWGLTRAMSEDSRKGAAEPFVPRASYLKAKPSAWRCREICKIGFRDIAIARTKNI